MSSPSKGGADGKVSVQVSSILHEYTGGESQLWAKGGTVQALLTDLERRHKGLRFRIIDEQDCIRPHIKIYVDGRQVQALKATVGSQAEVHILQALSGG